MPIVIAGQTVQPGDWIVGDDDGVMVLPKEQAVELANRAMDVLEKENRLRGEIEGGKTLSRGRLPAEVGEDALAAGQDEARRPSVMDGKTCRRHGPRGEKAGS